MTFHSSLISPNHLCIFVHRLSPTTPRGISRRETMCKASSASRIIPASYPSNCTITSGTSDATIATLRMETARSAENTSARVKQVAFLPASWADTGSFKSLKDSTTSLASRAPMQRLCKKCVKPSQRIQTQRTAPPQRWSTKNGSWCKVDNLFLFVVTWVFLLVRLNCVTIALPW